MFGNHRVRLRPGESAAVELTVHAARLAFSDRSFKRIVEPVDIELWIDTSAHRAAEAITTLVGDVHTVMNRSARLTRTREIA